ncbi:MAG: DUF2642 domain-containing protein [Trueperella sp.]|nr:DUF2642 domain-containing protein [Trueperella sp.]
MSWYVLAQDIASLVEQEARDELWGEAAELSAAEESTVELIDRLRGAIGIEVQLSCANYEYAGQLMACGKDWVALARQGSLRLVPIAAVSWVRLPRTTASSRPKFPRSLRAVLRALVAQNVVVDTTAGQVRGIIDRVGADYLVIASNLGDADCIVNLGQICAVASVGSLSAWDAI